MTQTAPLQIGGMLYYVKSIRNGLVIIRPANRRETARWLDEDQRFSSDVRRIYLRNIKSHDNRRA